MNKCLKKTLTHLVGNDKLLKFNEIKLHCYGKSDEQFRVCGSEWGIVDTNSNATIKIISTDGVTFIDGSTTLDVKTEKTKNILSDKKFTLSIIPKESVTVLNIKNDGSCLFSDKDKMDLSKLTWLTGLKKLRISFNFKGDINNLVKHSQVTDLIIGSCPDLYLDISNLPSSTTTMQITSCKNITGKIADVAKLNLTENKDWAFTIRNSGISGDLADVPSSVRYVTVPYPKLTWTKRKRTNAYLLAIDTTLDQLGFASHSDVDNMFIDQSTCTLDADSLNSQHDNKVKKIVVRCPNSYIPSTDAQAAIRTLYKKGLTNIIVNNIEMNKYK